MTCKACGQPYGCDHSDAEYQGVVPARRHVSVAHARRRVLGEPSPRTPRQRPEAPGSVPVVPHRPRHDNGGAAVHPESEPA